MCDVKKTIKSPGKPGFLIHLHYDLIYTKLTMTIDASKLDLPISIDINLDQPESESLSKSETQKYRNVWGGYTPLRLP